MATRCYSASGGSACKNIKPNGHAQPSKKTYFDYHDAHSALVYQVERTDYYDGRKKTFLQRRPDRARLVADALRLEAGLR